MVKKSSASWYDDSTEKNKAQEKAWGGFYKYQEDTTSPSQLS